MQYVYSKTIERKVEDIKKKANKLRNKEDKKFYKETAEIYWCSGRYSDNIESVIYALDLLEEKLKRDIKKEKNLNKIKKIGLASLL